MISWSGRSATGPKRSTPTNWRPTWASRRTRGGTKASITGAEEWVVGDVHTNSVEGVWSLFKRSIVGSFHKMSVKHMDRYLEELEWRFNNRNNPYIFRDALRRIVHTDPLGVPDAGGLGSLHLPQQAFQIVQNLFHQLAGRPLSGDRRARLATRSRGH